MTAKSNAMQFLEIQISRTLLRFIQEKKHIPDDIEAFNHGQLGRLSVVI